MGTLSDPVPVAAFAENFSPMPRMAPPGLGMDGTGALAMPANGLRAAGFASLPARGPAAVPALGAGLGGRPTSGFLSLRSSATSCPHGVAHHDPELREPGEIGVAGGSANVQTPSGSAGGVAPRTPPTALQ